MWSWMWKSVICKLSHIIQVFYNWYLQNFVIQMSLDINYYFMITWYWKATIGKTYIIIWITITELRSFFPVWRSSIISFFLIISPLIIYIIIIFTVYFGQIYNIKFYWSLCRSYLHVNYVSLYYTHTIIDKNIVNISGI